MFNSVRAPTPRGELEIGDRFADRYVLVELLGRGGTSVAYRADDLAAGRPVALKLLDARGDDARAYMLRDSFEREFHTLKQLAHPRVVQVWDYGVWRGQPYFTLELLDGGDLQSLAPLAWPEVCRVAYDLCSALSLLHSRRLLHRDLTPRNVRRTADGKTKLFDFGLLSPMGLASHLAGTPPCVAPELVNRGALDARSDLFSLGTTLYFALTNRVCFPARDFTQLADLWRSSPTPPSKLVPGIPKALDELVLELLRIDVGARPKSAGEVMDRLRPLLPEPPNEELSAALSYLSTPQLVGRELVVETFRRQLLRTMRGRGHGFLLVGERGTGRSRMLDSFLLEAKLIGVAALRVDGVECNGAAFHGAELMLRDLLQTSRSSVVRALRSDPSAYGALFSDPAAAELSLQPLLPRDDAEHASVRSALRGLLLEVAAQRPIALAVDDFEQLDEPSAALLAGLTLDAPQHRIVYAFTLNAATPDDATQALAICKQRATSLELGPLSLEQMHQLLASVFGDVPHLQQLSRRLFDLSGGRPGDCMALAQHLVDRGTIHYANGVWNLPEELTAELLPARMEEALARTIAALSPLARRLGLLLSISIFDRLSRSQLQRLPDTTLASLEDALEELRANRFIAGRADQYGLLDRSLTALFEAQVAEAQRSAAHRELAELARAAAQSPIAVSYHLLRAGADAEGAEHLLSSTSDPLVRIRVINEAEATLGTERTSETCFLVLQAAERVKRPIAELQLLRAVLAGMAARGGDPKYYYLIADAWLEQLKRDSGYYDWQALSTIEDPLTRIRSALGRVAERHNSMPVESRGNAPGDAIKQMTGYVIMSIAVSVRLIDLRLQRSLPGLLEPFAPLSPLVAAMFHNARATCLNGEGKREAARELFVDVLEKMDALPASELTYMDKVRAAISQTITEIDASLGIDSEYIARLSDLDRDPNQGLGAHYIQKVVALHRGDWEAAERHRHDAELLSLQSKTRAMFSTLGQELEAHGMARDLTGVKQVRAAVSAMAARHEGWVPVLAVADTYFHQLCGDLERALRAARSLTKRQHADSDCPWYVQAQTLEAELLLELGQPEAARELAEAALEHCKQSSKPFLARGLASVLCLAEAALGDYERARRRADELIAELRALGVRGLQLGRAYEHRARVAIAMGDAAAFSQAADAVKEHYRLTPGSLLSVSYQRLLAEARRQGLLNDEAPRAGTALQLAHASTIMKRCSEHAERASSALDLICAGDSQVRGFLFLHTRAGLVYAAGNTDQPLSSELTQIARRYFDSETQATHTTLTPADMQAAMQVTTTSSEIDGERYQPVLLHGLVRGEPLAVGVAMLSGCKPELVSSSRALLAMLAEHLIESGDFIGIPAN
jgi:tetratricopeptide (TPR) repeat protein